MIKTSKILLIILLEIGFLSYTAFQEYIPLDVTEMKAEVQKIRKPLSESALINGLDSIPFIFDEFRLNSSTTTKDSNCIRTHTEDTCHTIIITPQMVSTQCYFNIKKYNNSPFVFDEKSDRTTEIPMIDRPYP